MHDTEVGELSARERAELQRLREQRTATERMARRAEELLTANADRVRQQATLLELIPAGVIVREMDGRIRWWNAGAAWLYGRTLDEVRGRISHDVLATTFIGGGTAREQRESLESDGRWDGLLQHVSAEGRELTLISRQVVHKPQGETDPQVLEINTDVTAALAVEHARDRAAAALAERNIELEAANQLKLDIIGMLGHEISNPLSAILGYADLLAGELPPSSPHKRAVAAIDRQAQRLDDIVREALAMVAIDAGNINAVRQEVPLRDEIRRALENTGHGHVPVVGSDERVLFHPGHLHQIVASLVSNAARYAGGATALRIMRTGGTVRVAVEDEGPGVPEESRPRLFDRQGRSGKGPGLGLGLYVARSLARANHGEVFHEARSPRGSCFVVEAETADR
ncbi:hypothetical protein Acsp01_77650 [Actinoplanes sp. NBRC 101535]|nr:hypothetical protein Acsp01_77650 [Actinoplanes sp. NBRC 101535]